MCSCAKMCFVYMHCIMSVSMSNSTVLVYRTIMETYVIHTVYCDSQYPYIFAPTWWRHSNTCIIWRVPKRLYTVCVRFSGIMYVSVVFTHVCCGFSKKGVWRSSSILVTFCCRTGTFHYCNICLMRLGILGQSVVLVVPWKIIIVDLIEG